RHRLSVARHRHRIQNGYASLVFDLDHEEQPCRPVELWGKVFS
ncbi:MAG: hypothetical protein ACI87O_003092, partial [Planctomycetota bacterium]